MDFREIIWQSKLLFEQKLKKGRTMFMKKIFSLILTVCFVLFATNTILPVNVQPENDANSILNLQTASEFSSQLESENVDVSNPGSYEISVLIELDDLVSEKGLNFDAMNISADADNIDAELETHRNRVKEYYIEYNENIASTLEICDYEYYVSYYSPYIEIVFDDLSEYSRCESALVSAISDSVFVSSACSAVIINEKVLMQR